MTTTEDTHTGAGPAITKIDGDNIRVDAQGRVSLRQPDGSWSTAGWQQWVRYHHEPAGACGFAFYGRASATAKNVRCHECGEQLIASAPHFALVTHDDPTTALPLRGAMQADFLRRVWLTKEERDRPADADEEHEIHSSLLLLCDQQFSQPIEGVWPGVWANWRRRNAITVAARNTVAAIVAEGKIASADAGEALLGLRADLERHWPAVVAKLGVLTDAPASVDQRAKEALQALGGGVNPALAKEGSKAAKSLRPIAWPDPVPLARMVARALWNAETGPRLEGSRRFSAGVSVPLLTDYVTISRRGAQRSLLGEKDAIFSRGGRQLATIDHGSAEIDGRLVSHKAVGTLTAQKVMRWLVNVAHHQKFVLNKESPDRVSIVGGYSALAEMLGLEASAKAVQALREAIETLHVMHLSTEFWRGPLITRGLIPSAPGRKSVLDLKVHGPFEPGFAQRLKPSEARAFVPIPLPRLLPAFVGRENEWAAQANLQLLVLRDFRVRAREFAEAGCVLPIADHRWTALADEAEVPKATLPDVREAFATGKGTSPPFLIPEGGVLRLGQAYDVEQRTIAEAGGLSSEGRAGGLASARRRRQRK